MKRAILLLAIVGSFLALSPQPAQAQALQCENYPLFPYTDWTTNIGENTAGTNGGYVRNVLVTPPLPASPYMAIQVTHAFPTPRTVYQVTYGVYFNNADPAATANLSTYLSLGGNAAGTNTSLTPASLSWHTFTQYFYPSGNRADQISVIYRNNDPDLALQVLSLCWLNIPPTPTPTNTPADTAVPPSETPYPTWTYTPEPSETPTGTVTPAPTPTGTPLPSWTPLPSRTPAPATLSSGDFNTPVPPNFCQDPFNPCGALPFPVPNFTPLAISSPAPYTAVAVLGTPTLQGFQTPMPGGGTRTPEAGEGGVYDASTAIAEAVAGIAVTAELQDFSGTTIDAQNAGNEIGQSIGGMFGIIRSVQAYMIFLGKTGTLIAFLFLILLFVVLVKLLLFAFPILKKIAEFVFSVVKLLPFIG